MFCVSVDYGKATNAEGVSRIVSFRKDNECTSYHETFAYYCSRIRRTPLNLVRDPGSAAAMMLMISRDANTRDCFRGFDKIPEDSMKAILSGTLFRVVDGRLMMKDDGRLKTSPSVYLNQKDVGRTELIVVQS